MLDDRLIDLIRIKLKLANVVIKELPDDLQERINKQKKDFLNSLIEVIKEELNEDSKYSTKKDNKVKRISIE